MRSAVRLAYDHELTLANEARTQGDLDVAVQHLERAHILGQRYFIAHLRTHWMLLEIARRRSDRNEIVGQIIRLFAVLPGYLSGWVPKGNTGSANVSALKPMTPPSDLVPLLANHNVARDVAIRILLLVLATMIYGAVKVEEPIVSSHQRGDVEHTRM